MTPFRIILASASPRRLELLRGIGMEPEVVAPGIGEDRSDGESPRDMVRRLARAKCAHVASALPESPVPAMVLAADTAVVLGSRVLGKPADEEEEAEMLRSLSDRTHKVYTGVCLRRTDEDRESHCVSWTDVRFRELDDGWIRWYMSTGEPRDKAGAYGIQGLGVLLTESIQGSWSNVVGLPLERLPGLFRGIGLAFPPR